MKKFFIIAALAATLSLGAQVRVAYNGHLQVGSPGVSVTINPGMEKAQSFSLAKDSIAEMTIFGPKFLTGIDGTLAFGNGGKISVGGKSINTKAFLHLHGSDGVIYTSASDTILRYWDGSTPSFDFNCDIKSKGVVLYSDERMKSDVSDLNGRGELLAEVTPVKYSFTGNASGIKSKVSASQDRVRYGFIAQEIQDIYPELVVTDERGNLGVDYIGFIPLLVDEVKRLRAEVESFKYNISDEFMIDGKLKNAVTAGIGSVDGITTARLYQNEPNPFRMATVIKCDIPENAGDAVIYIYDIQGAQIMKKEISVKGHASVTIEGEKLRAGMYVYALIVDGEAIDSRRMILTD